MNVGHETPADAADTARRYYDTSDVDGFYAAVWGGEDIHMGVYAHEHEPVADASRRTVERMAGKVAGQLGPGRSVLDLGAGYGGPARQLAGRFGCAVTALNISESQNARHRRTNAERGLDHLIDVVTGSFQEIPFGDGQFDVVWSQDAFCHSGDRAELLVEAVRVLGREGHLVFTDVMAAEGAPPEALRHAVARLQVETLATPGFYRERLRELGLGRIEFEDLSTHLHTHYRRLDEETRKHAAQLRRAISPDYVDLLLRNLPLWVDATRTGHLRWGIFHCRRL